MNEKQQEIRKMQEMIEKGQKFLIISHRSVDGDAYGSSMALYFYLQSIGKTVEVVNELPITPFFHFLEIHNHITREIAGKKFDSIFVCDCGELRLTGEYPERYAEIFGNTPIINIDHHNRNSMFGVCNLVDTEASSTCELVYDLMENTPLSNSLLEGERAKKDNKSPLLLLGEGAGGGGGIISPQIATLLLFGIIRDTNCFKNSIHPHVFEVTSKLIALGAEYEKVIFHSYKSEKLNYLQLYGHVLENLISLKGGVIVGGILTQDIFNRYDIRENELGPQLINEILSSLEGTDFAFLVKETESGDRKLSFRARRDGIDVSRIAQYFGGGGHIQSAGAYTKASLDEILKVIEETDVKISL
ncbi:MAG: DHH family phosphoesterase [Candidatus Gracilibacteria bacterium]|nr:DHH family phosphoesterase [Candidatus Gracilibacteria bacterium]